MRITIGDYLLNRLAEAGACHALGVPGDYNLQFLEQVQAAERIEFVGACNELNAAYAACGYARLNGVAALLTTYGVGELSALCGVAQAAAEHLPVVCVTGAPPLRATAERLPLHHSLADGDYDNMYDCYRHFTATQARITPLNAVEEIDRAVRTCVLLSRPVYLQLPSDISYVTVEAPDTPLNLSPQASEPERLEAAVGHALRLLGSATRPVVLIDADADRFGLTTMLRQFVDAWDLPYAALSTGRALLDEDSRRYRGLYAGAASAPAVRELVEDADFLLTISPRFVEGNSGGFTQSLPAAAAVDLRNHSVTVGKDCYHGVCPRDLLRVLIDSAPVPSGDRSAAADRGVSVASTGSPWSPRAGAALTHDRIWPRLVSFLRPKDVVIVENGTSSAALSSAALPAGTTYITSAIWGAIGFSLPSVLGAALAAPQRRHVLFIGDGALQVTVQELSTILRRGQRPVIFLLNNHGYTIERYILGLHSAHNDIADWDYPQLLRVFAPNVETLSVSVHTEDELEEALVRASSGDTAALIELHLDPVDAPEALKTFGRSTAAFDYGPRGPQPGL